MHKSKPYIIFILLLGCALYSCAHYSKFVDAQGTKPVPSLLVTGQVAFEPRVPDPQMEARLPELLSLIGAKHDLTVVPNREKVPAGSSYAILNLWIKEQQYSRSLDQYNSIAGLLTITAPDTEEILVRAVYSEESEASIKSFQVLYTVLDELMQAVEPNIRRR